ncbi:hypothetical protein EON66_07190 [archaeon]|nr:MAG: hypothetical protein EON66_07190 [archaeon]
MQQQASQRTHVCACVCVCVQAKSIDVSNTETFNEFHSGLWLIIVLVWIAQLWQVINGGILLWMLSKKLNLYQPLYNYRDELQLLLIGCLFVFLGIRNFVATVQV